MLTFFDTFLQISTRGRINNIECIPIPINERKLLMEGKDTKWRWLLAITTSIRGFTHRPLSSSGGCERFELMIEKNHERLPLIPSQLFRSSAAERFQTLTKPLATKATENYRKKYATSNSIKILSWSSSNTELSWHYLHSHMLRTPYFFLSSHVEFFIRTHLFILFVSHFRARPNSAKFISQCLTTPL